MRQARGKHLEQHPVDDASLPLFATQIRGMMNAISGGHDRGIDVLERAIDVDNLFAASQAGGSSALDFLHALVYAYRATGQLQKANEVLGKAADYFAERAERNSHRGSDTLALMALNRSMRGDFDGAARTLSDAVDAGWRDYYYVLEDPRWRLLLERADVQPLMQRVKADLDRQRELVRKDDEDDSLRRLVGRLERELAQRKPAGAAGVDTDGRQH